MRDDEAAQIVQHVMQFERIAVLESEIKRWREFDRDVRQPELSKLRVRNAELENQLSLAKDKVAWLKSENAKLASQLKKRHCN